MVSGTFLTDPLEIATQAAGILFSGTGLGGRLQDGYCSSKCSDFSSGALAPFLIDVLLRQTGQRTTFLALVC